ncbi:MAG: LemA family protein [Candidatus Bathyarchaeota archaeon]|nr:LemA family protein [Candidatus Bathyarchaeota archaeon]
MKGKIIAAVVALIVIVIAASFAALYFSTYNNIVGLNANAESQWAQVEQELQRRYDLIPNIVDAARAYITYEGSILQNVTALRSQWMTAAAGGNLDAINNATAAMESGVSNLVVTFENYPDLQSSTVIQSLMITLEGTENRISTERMRFNDAVRDYNTAINVFPANLWAAGWGFDAKTYFQAQVGATEVPPVNL